MSTQISAEVLNNYQLSPNQHLAMEHHYQNNTAFGDLLRISRERYDGKDDLDIAQFEKEQYKIFEPLSQEKLQALKVQESRFSKPGYSSEELIELLKIILDEEMDQHIRSYFKSYYAVLWFGFRNVEIAEDNVSALWHCDGGPATHLKTITYLNSGHDHGSSTDLINAEVTRKLKQIGYVFCDIDKRKGNIDDLLDELGAVDQKKSMLLTPGETILFNPFQVIHKAGFPHPGQARECFDLCILPSPVPWDEAIESGVIPGNGCVPFEVGFTPLLQLGMQKMKETKKHEGEVSFASTDFKPMVFDDKGSINSMDDVRHILMQVFNDVDHVEFVAKQIEHLTKGVVHFREPRQLLDILKQAVKSNFDWKGFFSPNEREKIFDILNFEEKYHDSMIAYVSMGKPNPDAVFWPIPNHPDHPKNKHDMLPYVKKHGIFNKKTPIVSAGSCFAFEIARVLQDQGFNYVVSERADNPADGVIVDGYNPGDKHAKFSANYGILFNTPSLYQLAEKAFGLREFEPYLIKLDNGLYTDPYRENVFFRNKESFVKDYKKHYEAVYNSLMNAEAFIFTAGLNECWQLTDGTVISRNPKAGFHHMMQHRVLSVQENVDYITKFYTEVKRRNPNFKMILTLSPIPLLATARAQTHHILEANTHSKAVLRVAIDEVVSKHEDIYYLPSYEYVMECAVDPWEEDHRHVTPETVNNVVNMFKEMFFI